MLFNWPATVAVYSSCRFKVKRKRITVLVQFVFKRGTPKAFANSSPGLLQPWVHVEVKEETLKAFDWDEPLQGL
jgi:hypothetical protein